MNQTPRPASYDLRRLHEVTQTIAFGALRYEPNPVAVDLDPVDQDDDDQEREQ